MSNFLVIPSLPSSFNPYFRRAFFLRECARLNMEIGDYESAAEYLNASYRWETYGDAILAAIGFTAFIFTLSLII